MASSLETNKIIGAILTAGIIASGSGVVSRIIYSPEYPQEPAYQVVMAEAEGDGEAAAEEKAAPLPQLLANASVDDGESVARACQACHSFEQGGPNKIGPPLWAIVGADIAAHEGFAYSDALAGKEGEWTFETLSAFLEDPRGWAPGTKMSYAGVQDPQDRADLLVYLRSLSEDPVPLPEPETVVAEAEPAAEEPPAGEEEAAQEPAAAEEDAEQAADAAPAGDGSIAARLAEASAEEGESAVRVCQACHSFEQGGPNKIGPALWDVVERDIAAVEDFSYSDALAGKEGVWDYQALDAYLENPRAWAPGTKMAFAGIKKPDQRADVIAYLRSLSDDPEPLPEAAAGDGDEARADAEAQDAAQEQQTAAAEGTEQAAPEEGAPQEQQTAAREAPAGDEDAAAAGDEAGGDQLAALLAGAEVAAGEQAARICAACHSFEQGGPNKIGPRLWGVVGRDIAAVEDFSYSDALAQKEGSWTYQELDAYLENPRAWAPGTKMAFAGIKQADRRADVIRYLRSLSEDPEPLPEGG